MALERRLDLRRGSDLLGEVRRHFRQRFDLAGRPVDSAEDHQQRLGERRRRVLVCGVRTPPQPHVGARRTARPPPAARQRQRSPREHRAGQERPAPNGRSAPAADAIANARAPAPARGRRPGSDEATPAGPQDASRGTAEREAHSGQHALRQQHQRRRLVRLRGRRAPRQRQEGDAEGLDEADRGQRTRQRQERAGQGKISRLSPGVT